MPRANTKKVDQTYNRVSSHSLLKAATKVVKLTLPQPHPAQFDFIQSFNNPLTRFLVAACGTKWGKTFGCSIHLVSEAWTYKGSLNWWIAPTFVQSKMAYETIKSMLPLGTYIEYKADLKLVLLEPDGAEHSQIVFKSGDNADSLRGFGVDRFVMDEAARISYEAFVSVLTTVTQTGGKGIIISTPKGRGWFHDVYQRGLKKDEEGNDKFSDVNPDPFTEWLSVRLPTWNNPYVPVESIEQAKKNLPADVFRQEYAAEFIDDSAGVFRGVTGCVKGADFEPYNPSTTYVMGVDLARIRDFTVLTVIDKQRRHVVYTERFNQISWEVQYHKIIQIARQYNAQVCIDSTGIGDPIVQTLSNAGLRITPYKIGTSAAKQQLIDRLRVAIENNEVSYPYNKYTAAMLEELRCYEMSMTENGVTRYSAPSGKHDDCVISLALAYWACDQPEFRYRARMVPGI